MNVFVAYVICLRSEFVPYLYMKDIMLKLTKLAAIFLSGNK